MYIWKGNSSYFPSSQVLFWMSMPCPAVWHKTTVSTQWDETRALAEIIPHGEMKRQDWLGERPGFVPTGHLPLVSCGLERKTVRKTPNLISPQINWLQTCYTAIFPWRPVSAFWKHKVSHHQLCGQSLHVFQQHVSACSENKKWDVITQSCKITPCHPAHC